MNDKRTYRLNQEKGLAVQPKLRERKRVWRFRYGGPGIGGPSDVWATVFISGRLFDAHTFRILTVVDCHPREALSLTPMSQQPRDPGD